MKVIFWSIVNVLCLCIGAGIGWIALNSPECMYVILGVLFIGCIYFFKEEMK